MDYQSSYRKNYNTETMLVKLYGDILQGVVGQSITQLVALDLYATVDTVNHEILLKVLREPFGVCVGQT